VRTFLAFIKKLKVRLLEHIQIKKELVMLTTVNSEIKN